MKPIAKIVFLWVALALCLWGAFAQPFGQQDGNKLNDEVNKNPAPPSNQYQFGTVVTQGDVDIGRPLISTTPALLMWDIGVETGCYDEVDVVYLHFGSATVTQVNDLRLTPFGSLPAGSKVNSADNDIGQPLIPIPVGFNIKFADLYGVRGGYDHGDPVYLSAPPAGPGVTATNDVRLTTIFSKGLLAGEKVKDFDADHTKATLPLGASIAFYNANGNLFPPAPGTPIYDFPDSVYIDVAPFLVVSPGDIRLTPSM